MLININKCIPLFKEAYSYIKQGRLDKAILTYNKLSNKLRELKYDKSADKLRKDVAILHRELTLYIRLNIAFTNAQEGNFEFLNNELQLIHDITYGIRTEKEKTVPIEYGQNNSQFLLEVCTAPSTLSLFEEQYKNLLRIVDENNINKAMKEFIQLIVIYNKLYLNLEREKRLELYSKLKGVYRDLSIKKLFAMAREKPKNISGRVITQRKVFVGGEAETKKPELKIQQTKPMNKFEELHELIKKGDYSQAIEFYENL